MCNLSEPIGLEVPPAGDDLHRPLEGLEVAPLCGHEWMCFEERDNDPVQLCSPLDRVSRKRLTVIVSASLNDDSPTAEVLSHQLEGLHRSERLGDRELVLDLPAEAAPCVLHDRDREAAFTIGEAGYPLRGTWPFLLIARTEQIVTAHRVQRISNPCDTTDEYCRILGVSSI